MTYPVSPEDSSQTVSQSPSSKPSTASSQEQLIDLLSPELAVLGYQLVHLEVSTHRQKTLRLFIDHLAENAESVNRGVGIEDCVKVSRALDEKLDQIPLVNSIFHGTYELEVSSPGADRPLRTPQDFKRFTGRETRIHTYRSLTAHELGDASYQEKNPKQKNFIGTLAGFEDNHVILVISNAGSPKKSNKKSKAPEKAELSKNSQNGIQIRIPLLLISKANLEPHFDFEANDERE